MKIKISSDDVSTLSGAGDLFVFNDTIEGPRAPLVKPAE